MKKSRFYERKINCLLLSIRVHGIIVTFAKCFDAAGFNICRIWFGDKFHMHLNRVRAQSREFYAFF